MNHYEILNIQHGADKAAIKRAYFAAVKKHPPDADPEGFKAVRAAYETLFDEKQRAEYDSFFNAPDSVQNELLAARELMRRNKYKQAVELLTGLDSEGAELKRLLAEALWNTKKSGLAENICKELMGKDPFNVDTLVLRGRIAASRGHTSKADGYFNRAVGLEPGNPKCWHAYVDFSLEHYKWQVPEVIGNAVAADPDMFRDRYHIYLHGAFEGMGSRQRSLFQQMFSGTDGFSDRQFMYLSKFTEFFINDSKPGKQAYNSAVTAMGYILSKDYDEGLKNYAPIIEKMLPVLETCEHRSDDDENLFKNARAFLAHEKLDNDGRIHAVIADLTAYFIAEDGESGERLGMECAIVALLPEIRASLKILRSDYPEYFALNQGFYTDALNEKRYEYLHDKYYAIQKRLNPSIVKNEFETAVPYVREAPKTGRNDPCPCGSGKKYKKCCGKG